jgi:predicted amidohydrolase
MLQILETMVPFQPDILCLPETFAFNNIENIVQAREAAAAFPGTLFEPLMAFARMHKCYLICPTYLQKNESIYNAAVLIDRKGEIAGEYLKMHPSASEIEAGIRPGPLDAPVFKTDFGKVGIQICYDVKWDDGWTWLKQQGAKFIFWPSAYPGGNELCSKAWKHQVYVVSSTRKGISRICDISGEEISRTGFWQPGFTCSPVNPEKAMVPTWPYTFEFPAIVQKYNRKVSIRTFDEEEWTIIESLDPSLDIAGILSEFGLRTQDQVISDIDKIQKMKR